MAPATLTTGPTINERQWLRERWLEEFQRDRTAVLERRRQLGQEQAADDRETAAAAKATDREVAEARKAEEHTRREHDAAGRRFADVMRRVRGAAYADDERRSARERELERTAHPAITRVVDELTRLDYAVMAQPARVAGYDPEEEARRAARPEDSRPFARFAEALSPFVPRQRLRPTLTTPGLETFVEQLRVARAQVRGLLYAALDDAATIAALRAVVAALLAQPVQGISDVLEDLRRLRARLEGDVAAWLFEVESRTKLIVIDPEAGR